MEKKLYKLDFTNKICECEVIKETAKTYKYRYAFSTTIWVVHKHDVNAPQEDFTKNIATSKQNLIEAINQSVDYQIRNHQIKIKELQEKKQGYNQTQD